MQVVSYKSCEENSVRGPGLAAKPDGYTIMSHHSPVEGISLGVNQNDYRKWQENDMLVPNVPQGPAWIARSPLKVD